MFISLTEKLDELGLIYVCLGLEDATTTMYFRIMNATVTRQKELEGKPLGLMALLVSSLASNESGFLQTQS